MTTTIHNKLRALNKTSIIGLSAGWAGLWIVHLRTETASSITIFPLCADALGIRIYYVIRGPCCSLAMCVHLLVHCWVIQSVEYIDLLMGPTYRPNSLK